VLPGIFSWIGPKQFVRQADHLGSLTYRQAQLDLGLDVGQLLGVPPEDRALLVAHAGIDDDQLDFLTKPAIRRSFSTCPAINPSASQNGHRYSWYFKQENPYFLLLGDCKNKHLQIL
jgi:hypothetical protein